MVNLIYNMDCKGNYNKQLQQREYIHTCIHKITFSLQKNMPMKAVFSLQKIFMSHQSNILLYKLIGDKTDTVLDDRRAWVKVQNSNILNF